MDDLSAIIQNTKRVGKSVESYLRDLKFDEDKILVFSKQGETLIAPLRL